MAHNDPEINFNMENGTISLEALNKILNLLPFEIDYVDAEDNFSYFADSTKKIFPRDQSQLGKNVVSLHPAPMQPKVASIIKSFHAGTSKKEEFWLPIKGKMIYICYYALYNDDNEYIGCFEISGDITHFQELKGMKGL